MPRMQRGLDVFGEATSSFTRAGEVSLRLANIYCRHSSIFSRPCHRTSPLLFRSSETQGPPSIRSISRLDRGETAGGALVAYDRGTIDDDGGSDRPGCHGKSRDTIYRLIVRVGGKDVKPTRSAR